METALGRYFEALELPQRQLLKMVLDLVTGRGADVSVEVRGRELVFYRGVRGGRGFVRILPGGLGLRLSFPKGPELCDPAGRLQGPIGLEQSLVVEQKIGLDGYIRRLVDSAYSLEG